MQDPARSGDWLCLAIAGMSRARSATEPNLARFDLVSLRLAVLCAELGSLSKAARQVHCSISTASYRLSMLEHAFGKTLFRRDHRGLRTTDEGKVLVRRARSVLAQVEIMAAEVTRGAEPAAGCDRLGGDLEAAMRRWPQAE